MLLSAILTIVFSTVINARAINRSVNREIIPGVTPVTNQSDKFKPAREGFAIRALEKTKRQAFLRKGVRAVFDYECPFSGPQTRVFRWEMKWFRNTDEVKFFPVENIDQWDHVTRVTNDFGTNWYAKYCAMHGDRCCTYSVKAQTLGAFYPSSNRMDLELTTSRMNAEEAPSVLELCILVQDLHHCSAQCPISEIDLGKCEITTILATSF